MARLVGSTLLPNWPALVWVAGYNGDLQHATRFCCAVWNGLKTNCDTMFELRGAPEKLKDAENLAGWSGFHCKVQNEACILGNAKGRGILFETPHTIKYRIRGPRYVYCRSYFPSLSRPAFYLVAQAPTSKIMAIEVVEPFIVLVKWISAPWYIKWQWFWATERSLTANGTWCWERTPSQS